MHFLQKSCILKSIVLIGGREALLKCVFFSNLLSSFLDFAPLVINLSRHLSKDLCVTIYAM